MNVTIQVLAAEFFTSQFNHHKEQQKETLIFTFTVVVTRDSKLPLPHPPLHHRESVVEPGSEHIPNEVLCQTTHGLQQGAQVPQGAVQPAAVVLRSDVQPVT